MSGEVKNTNEIRKTNLKRVRLTRIFCWLADLFAGVLVVCVSVECMIGYTTKERRTSERGKK